MTDTLPAKSPRMERMAWQKRIPPYPGLKRNKQAEKWVHYRRDPKFQSLIKRIEKREQMTHSSNQGWLLGEFLILSDDAFLDVQHGTWLKAEKNHDRWVSYMHPIYGELLFIGYRSYQKLYLVLCNCFDFLKKYSAPYRRRYL